MRNNVFKALAHPLRREVLNILRDQPQLAGDMAEMFDVSWPTVSRHLSVLKEADLVITERNGTQILYRLNTSVVQDVATLLLGLTGTGEGLSAEDVPVLNPLKSESKKARNDMTTDPADGVDEIGKGTRT